MLFCEQEQVRALLERKEDLKEELASSREEKEQWRAKFKYGIFTYLSVASSTHVSMLGHMRVGCLLLAMQRALQVAACYVFS